MVDNLESSVEIALGGQPRRLVVTLAAIKEIDLRFGNFFTAQTSVTNSSFAAISFCIWAGLGDKDLKLEDVEAMVFKEGFGPLYEKVLRFTDMCLNNGLPPLPGKGKGDEDSPGED